MAIEGAVVEASESKEFHNGFCEVCQKDGRVLFCENCTRAFHVACIERFVDLQTLGIQDRWVCPVCVHGAEVLLRGYKKPQVAEEQMEDLLSLVSAFFAGDDFGSQPRFVVQADCGDGRLLVELFELVKETPRGKVMKDFPLTMVGIGGDEESLVAPKIGMCAKRIPHKVLTGDVRSRGAVVAALKQRKIDAHRTLFLQVCQDRPRRDASAVSGPVATFARQAMGNAAGSEVLFAALLEDPLWPLEHQFHHSRLCASDQDAEDCAELAKGGMGLCLAEVQSHSPGPNVLVAPAAALAMAAAMVGLFPQDVKLAQPYPMRDETGDCDVFCQVLSRRNFRVRFALPEDLPALEVLEERSSFLAVQCRQEMAWKKHMRTPREGLLKRLQTSPTTNFALEVDGQVRAVLYTQRIRKPEDVYRQKLQQVFEGHVEGGPVLQLIAIHAHTEHRGLGTELRSFALHLARLDPTIESVCAVTLCHDYASSGVKNMQQYQDMHVHGKVNDRILTFHTSYGAKVLGLVPGYRPEEHRSEKGDFENEATGVLIQYKPKDWAFEPALSIEPKAPEAKQEVVKRKEEPQVASLEILSSIMTEMGYEVDMDNLDQGFFSSGLDSFDMGVIQNRLGRALGRTLPATLMLDLPTVKELTEHLDKERGVPPKPRPSQLIPRPLLCPGPGLVSFPPQQERASDETITEWVRCWRQYLYKKQKARQRSASPRQRRSRSTGRSRGPGPWEEMKSEDLEKIQTKLAWLLRLPQNQRRLQHVADKPHENEALFLCELRVVLDSVLGPLFMASGLDMKPRSLQDARDDMEGCALSLGGSAASRHKELLSLMKLDQASRFPKELQRFVFQFSRSSFEALPNSSLALAVFWPGFCPECLASAAAAAADLMMRHQRECKRIASASVRNRDRTFLKAIDDVAPFASRPALRRIQNSEAKTSRVRMPQIVDDDSDGSVSAGPDVRTLDPQSHTPEMYKDVLAEGIRLKKYQAEGVGWMIQGFFDRCGGILADDMGLGKTLMTLTFLSYLKVKERVPGPALVVVPLSCAGNWLREARKFVPHLSIAKVCGNSKEKSLSLDDNEIWFGMKDIIVTTYETVVNIENYFGRMFWKAVILDEAYRAKNSASRIREALEETHSACRILLTGTPLQNSLKELHALLKFLWPDVLAKQSEMFENAIQLPELAQKAEKACINQVMVDKIRGLLALSMKRRKKEEVLSLPPKIFHDVWLPMSPLQVQWYRRILSLKNTQMSRDIRSLKKLILRLRNVCIHPRLAVASKEDEEFMLSMGVCSQEEIEQLKDGPLVSEEIIGQSYKLAFVDALLTHLHAQNMGLNDNWRKTFEARTKDKDVKRKSASAWLKNASGPLFLDDMKYHRMQLEGGKEHAGFLDGMEDVDWDTPQPHKVLIFCQHQNCMDLLEEYCKFRGYRCMRMDGSTNRVLRELDMRDFNAEDEDIFIYLISTRAGGLGVNLASANHVILFEQDWNPHVDHQAIDRAHRIGQSRQVHIHRPIQEWAVEERLLIRSNAKLEMEKNIIGDRDQEDNEKEDPEEQLDAEEIMSILNNGESAFKVFEGDTFSFDLEEYFERKRAPMPEVKDRSPLRPPRPRRRREVAPPPEPDDVMRSGSGRVVKRKLTFAEEFCTAPMKSQRKTDVVKLKHIPKCFTCGVKDERPLQECACCPMSYHVQCVGHTPKKWTCPWHYCSSCSRSANQVGGMLIHCLECPTSLCYDCFPPDFRRVYPPDRFWDEMKKRGWNVTPAKMAFFKCNSCRTLEEQQKRLKMRAEDLAVQQDAEKKAALEEKRNLAAVKKRKMDEEAQRRMQEYKVQHQQQRVAEEISHWRARLERTAEKLWPKQFRRIWQGARGCIFGI
eukprot:s2850_g2.t1